MNREQLAYEVSKRVDLPKSTVKDIIKIVFSVVEEGIRTDGRVYTPIGIFSVKTMKPRRFRNVNTGEITEIGERKKVAFKSRIIIDE